MSGKIAAVVAVALAPILTVVLLAAFLFIGLTDDAAQADDTALGETECWVPTPAGQVATLDEAQSRVASLVVAKAVELNVPQDGMVIALMVGLAESGLRNLPSKAVPASMDLPHDTYPDGSVPAGDHDSVGVFQQRAAGWGTVAQRMDVSTSAGFFFQGGATGAPGLLDTAGWKDMSYGAAAQAVQVSAYPSAYAPHESTAVNAVTAILADQGQVVSTGCSGDAMACPPTGLLMEAGLTPDALIVARCVVDQFGIRNLGGVGERASNSASDHPSGRAVDVMIDGYQSAQGRALGDEVAEWVRANAARMGVNYVIWNARIWSVDRAQEGWRPYTHPSGATDDNSAHRNHVHVSVFGNAAVSPVGTAGGWVYPLANYRLTARFGECSALWSSCHTGLDFAAPTGTPIMATAAGRVTYKAWGGAYGNLTKIDHGGGIETWYAHQVRQSVRVGQQVQAGQVIGAVGETGNVTGEHLHLEVRRDGTAIDPDAWLKSHVGAPVPTGGSSTGFGLGSFNVLGSSHTAPGGKRASWASGPARIPAVIRLLNAHRIDVVGFQEFQANQKAAFNAHTGTAWGVWSGSSDTENSIAWRTSEWAFVSGDTVAIPYFNGRTRQMPVVRLRSTVTGRDAIFANFHNPANTARFHDQQRYRVEATRREVALVNGLVARYGRSVYVTGDFNERAAFFCRFTANGNMTAAAGGSTGTPCTPPAYGGIDWIFGGTGTSFSGWTVDRSPVANQVSDHPLVTARVG